MTKKIIFGPTRPLCAHDFSACKKLVESAPETNKGGRSKKHTSGKDAMHRPIIKKVRTLQGIPVGLVRCETTELGKDDILLFTAACTAIDVNSLLTCLKKLQLRKVESYTVQSRNGCKTTYVSTLSYPIYAICIVNMELAWDYYVFIEPYNVNPDFRMWTGRMKLKF